jgi:hypothetical protein
MTTAAPTGRCTPDQLPDKTFDRFVSLGSACGKLTLQIGRELLAIG